MPDTTPTITISGTLKAAPAVLDKLGDLLQADLSKAKQMLGGVTAAEIKGHLDWTTADGPVRLVLDIAE